MKKIIIPAISINPDEYEKFQSSATEDGFIKVGAWLMWLARNRIIEKTKTCKCRNDFLPAWDGDNSEPENRLS